MTGGGWTLSLTHISSKSSKLSIDQLFTDNSNILTGVAGTKAMDSYLASAYVRGAITRSGDQIKIPYNVAISMDADFNQVDGDETIAQSNLSFSTYNITNV